MPERRITVSQPDALPQVFRELYGPGFDTEVLRTDGRVIWDARVAVSGGALVVKDCFVAGGVACSGELTGHLLLVGGPAVVRTRDEECLVTAETPLLLSAGRRYQLRNCDAWGATVIGISASYLDEQAEAMGLTRPRLRERLDTGRAGTVVRLAQLLESQALGEDPLADVGIAEALTAALARSLLVAQGALVEPVHLTPGMVRQAEAYMEAHLARPLRAQDVARALGVSVRSLERAFRAHRGRSPGEHLRERRLHAARRRLQAGAGVLEAALSCGYTCPSRFGNAYKAHFGERPSETLRRGAAEEPSEV